MTAKLNPRQWKIYNYLKNHCVGKENKMQGSEICRELGIEYTITFKKDIHAIRNCETITRRIGSDPTGYWLMLENEDGLDYIKRLATTQLKTAVSQGISTSYFHQILNSMSDDEVVDKQRRIVFTPYEKEEVNKYSNDLLGGANGN